MKATKEDKRQQIIDAAIKVFSHKGYHKTRMEEIAVEAGIGKGTIYEYFSSKIQLFQAMIVAGFRKYYEEFNVENLRSLPFGECLRVLTEAHMHFCIENTELTQVLFMEKAAPDPELLQWAIENRDRYLQDMKELISSGMEKRELRQVDPQLLVYIIQASMMSFCIPIIMEGWNVEPAYFAQQYVDIMMNGIGNHALA